MFQFLYVTDLHGWTKGYEEILQIALQENIDTIVNGGDIAPSTTAVNLTGGTSFLRSPFPMIVKTDTFCP